MFDCLSTKFGFSTPGFLNVFKCSKHAKVLSKSILCFFKCSSLMEFLANLWHWVYSLFNVECIFFSMYLFLNVFVSSSNNISSGFVCFYLVFRWLMDWFIHHKQNLRKLPKIKVLFQLSFFSREMSFFTKSLLDGNKFWACSWCLYFCVCFYLNFLSIKFKMFIEWWKCFLRKYSQFVYHLLNNLFYFE